MPDTKLRPTSNDLAMCTRYATSRNSYLNIICIKLVTQVKKINKIRTFDLKMFLGF